MRAQDRRKIDMGDRAAEFGHANPADSAAYTALLGVLDELRTRARTSAAQQLEGVAQARGGSALRQALEAELRRTHLPHLTRVGASATQEQPEVGPTYRLKSSVRTVRGFLTAVGAMAESARSQRELLGRHGLQEAVLDDLTAKMSAYEEAVRQSTEGRLQHIGATAQLRVLADEIVRVVQVMDGFQRLRFAKDPERLAAWVSASSIRATPRAVEPDAKSPPSSTPEPVRPAA
jgi:hypothetical protein